MSNIAEEAFERLKHMVSGPKETLVSISLSPADQSRLRRGIVLKLQKHASVPEYNAGLIADSIIVSINEFIQIKTQEAKQTMAKKHAAEQDEDLEGEPVQLSSIFRRVND